MSKESLLLVEDDKVFADMLTKLITDAHGYEIVHVETLDQLKPILQNQSDAFFAAVVDRHLPDAPNGEAIKATIKSDIPVIVFTGTTNEASEDDLWANHIADYANKTSSFGLEYVVWAVRRLYENAAINVLVVDDSQTARKLMSRLLETQRFQVTTAANGKDAMAAIESNDKIQLAIIDCNLGDNEQGYDLAAAIRQRFKDRELEIIGVSSHSARFNSPKFIKAGANDFLMKPLIPEEFLCRVNHAVDRIEKLNKLNELNEIKTRFLSMAAHDIRGPLASIQKAAEYLKQKQWSQERADALLTLILNNSKDTQALLTDLLEFSALEAGKITLNKSKVPICAIVQERIDLYHSQADTKGITVNLNMEDILEMDTVLVDKIKIQQVIDNLLTNAIKFSPPDTAISIQLNKGASGFELTVCDAGPGVKEEEVSQLFEAYTVLSSKSTAGEKQTGLGLNIAKNIVDAHDGDITYENVASGGACFRVSLPSQSS